MPKELYAEKLISQIRAFSDSIFMSGLSNSRSTEEKIQTVDEFFSRCKAEVALNPEEHSAGTVFLYLVIRKYTK